MERKLSNPSPRHCVNTISTQVSYNPYKLVLNDIMAQWQRIHLFTHSFIHK